jgi:preprotein translocase subunit SecG
MVILLTIIFVISAILLAALVLLQDEQGEGIGGMFGGGSGTPFGSRAGNILTRATAILGAIFLLSAFGVAWLNRTPSTDDVEARARARQLQQGERSDWYAPDSPAQPQSAAPAPAADPAAAAPAAAPAAAAPAPAPAEAPKAGN